MRFSLAALAAPLALAGPVEGPVAAVESLQEALLAVAKRGGDADHAALVETLAPAVRARLDAAAMARDWLGPTWEGMEPEQRGRIAEAVGELLVADWAARLPDLHAERFSAAELQGPGDTAARVTSRLETAKGPGVAFEYGLRGDADGAWRIVQLLEDGEPVLARVVGPPPAGEADGLVAWLGGRAKRFGESPADVVARLQDGLLDVMRRAAELGFDGRLEALTPLVADTHDLPEIARLSLSRSWKALGEQERRRFRAVFRELSIATYAARFDGFSGETFQRTAVEELRRGGVLVKTVLVKSDGGRVSLDYLMRRSGGRWLVLNVLADGVSDLATKRSEYKAVMGRSGFEGLVAELEDQIERLRAGHEG